MARMPAMPMLEFGAGVEDRIEQMMRVLDREVQFPAERADEVHAQQVHIGRKAHLGHLAGEPGKRGVVQGRVGELRQHFARARAGDARSSRGSW